MNWPFLILPLHRLVSELGGVLFHNIMAESQCFQIRLETCIVASCRGNTVKAVIRYAPHAANAADAAAAAMDNTCNSSKLLPAG